MIWAGFAYAAGAAIGHSCIDASRKWASQRFSDRELVALVALLDALLLSSMALLSGGFDLFSLTRLDTEYVAALLVTAAIKALVGFMYQRALHVSPLSVTVPYLAFTPVLLVFTSYVIINELPSSQGLMGIVVVTLGGYFLALDHPAEVEVKKSDEPPGKIVSILPLLPWNSSKACDKVPKFSTDGDGVVLDLSEKNSPPVAIPGGNSSWWPQIQWEEGTLLMLGVAALLSISNSLDKMAGHLAPSLLNFAALQRGFTAVPVVLYLLVTSPKSFSLLIHFFPVLLAISLFEVVAFICYLKSLEILLVSYAVAAKRSNVLLSVLIGRVMFKEKIWRRLPFILMMVGGMTLILLA
ncbi:uncharacterized protein LOC9636729 [Selaginella moellendorffii]|uniref:uncharacterized protein LOC9636729 n=1 Tax=Selaginella moellendorffii TaxID=88036 RepID=UPI000D1CAB41|nr:uncharacterized protein LOC9636729 [Selaginella moellendorffii]|eukprot:XP_024535395.1 uncharacterized protein LOC9636729 [Selaginella moellendorffii]